MDINNQKPNDYKVKTSDHYYLDQLQFDPALRKSWLNFFVSNFRVVILLIIIISAAGIYSFIKLPREDAPEVVIPIGTVVTTYPGASPSNIEQLVTKPIETQIAGLKGLDTVTSTSSNSVSTIVVQFQANQNIDDAIRNLKDKVNAAVPNLPSDATTPVVTQISLDDQPIAIVALSGPYDGYTLRKYGEDAQSELENIPGVRQVNVSGGFEKEYQVAYDPSKLLAYGISVAQANQAITATNLSVPAGNFDGPKFIYAVQTDSQVTSADQIGGIAITVGQDGTPIYVRDVATVTETAVPQTTISRLSLNENQPENAVTLSIIKRTGDSVIDTVNQVTATLNQLQQNWPGGLHYTLVQNNAKEIQKSFSELERDFIFTLLLVVGILFLIVGLKESFVAGLAIPLVFFVTFTGLNYLGISLNFLSLFSLILALGLLVDDAIVVVSATKQYLKTGKFTPEQAVLLVLRDFKVVLTTTTLTTVWAFLPLLMSTGIIGSYIKSIPVTVSITLIASLLIALMINHPLAAVLERVRLTRKMFYLLEALIVVIAAACGYAGGIWGYLSALILLIILGLLIWWYEQRGGKARMIASEELSRAEWKSDDLIKEKLRHQGDRENHGFFDRLLHGIIHFDLALPIYEKYLRGIIMDKKKRRLTIGLTFLVFLFAIAMPVTGAVQSIFFPDADSNYLYVDVRGPIGQKLAITDQTMQQVEKQLLKYPQLISTFSTITGSPSALASNSQGGENTGSVSIVLKDESQRPMKSYDFAKELRTDLSSIKGAAITVEEQSSGPPSGAAFQAQISGDDLTTLAKITRDLQPKLASIPGVINIDSSLKNTAPQYTFKLDPGSLARNGLTSAYVGSVLRTAISGTKVSTIFEGNKQVNIEATFDPASIPDLQSLQNMQIINPQGKAVFLKDLGTIVLEPDVDSITRINQKRTITLSAGVDASTNSNKVLAQFQKNISGYKLPTGYSISYGGENKQNQDSVISIIQAMFIAIALILATLIIQFNSFRRAFIVLVTIPLALIGVFIGMAVFNVPLSFPGLIGILALFGIVVKNAIILMDKINLNMRSKIPYFEAIIDAGKSRLEAIFITSICTIFGILPITLSNPTWTSLGSAVIFGLMLSSFLTLFMVPTLFVSWIKPEEVQ